MVLLTSRGCHVSPGRWLHLLLGEQPHPTLLVCKALLGFSWCCIKVRWHKSKFLHMTQLCQKTKSPCACKHASKYLLKKRKKKQQCQGKRTSPARCTWLCEHLGAKAQGSPRAGPSRALLPALHLPAAAHWSSIAWNAPSDFSIPGGSTLRANPPLGPLRHLQLFFVCLMILDWPFSLGSACIASPRLLFINVVTIRSAHGIE